LADLRSSEGRSHVHYNLFYSPLKHKGPLLPPAAALAPTLWPQFHLRWACPSEAQAGELEAQCRNMSLKFSELQKVMNYFLATEPIQCSHKNTILWSNVVLLVCPRLTDQGIIYSFNFFFFLFYSFSSSFFFLFGLHLSLLFH
jgi:hypothetical protein